MKRARSVDEYVASAAHWRDELKRLREILRATGLDEEVKWGAPCYTHEGKNIVGIGGFKSYFGLWFYQGALLEDEDKVLISAQGSKTKALRQCRMHSASEIRPAAIKRYVKEATRLASEGKSIGADRQRPVVVPAELKRAFGRNRDAANAFRKLRKGLQREYADYVADAKRADTKERRIEKILPMIIADRGLHDKYR